MKRLPSGRKLASIDGGKAVAERLSQAREAAYGRVIEVLGSQRCRRLLLDLFKWAEIGEWRSRPKSSAPLLAFGARQLNRRWSKVREGGARIAAVDAETRHQLRIDVKKMRYSAEFLAGLHRDKKADLQRAEFLAGLADLQDHLGDLNDAETARELLSTLHLESEDERRFAATLVGREPDMEECLKAAQEAFERSAAASRYWR
jgi:CHAD domain-containing protein